MPPKLLACVRFPHKVVHKICHLRKLNRSREIEYNFLTALTFSMKFGTLVQYAPGLRPRVLAASHSSKDPPSLAY